MARELVKIPDSTVVKKGVYEYPCECGNGYWKLIVDLRQEDKSFAPVPDFALYACFDSNIGKFAIGKAKG